MKKIALSILAAILFTTGAFAQCFTPVWSAPSQDTMWFHVTLATDEGSNLGVGDVIGIFDGDLCVGAGTLTNPLTGSNSLVIMTLVNNSTTDPTIDGYTTGNAITYRFCSGTPIAHNVTPTYVSGSTIFAATAGTDSAVVQLVAVNTPPTFTTPPILTAQEDALYTSVVEATDVDVGTVLTYSTVGTVPSWLTFTPGTRTLTGTPTNDDVGDNNITLRVNDGTVDVDQTFTINVSNTNDAPTFISSPVTGVLEDAVYTYIVEAEDVDAGDVLTYSAFGTLPSWLTFTPATRTLTGTPLNENVGDTTVTLRVYDGTVNVDQTFTISVTNTNDPPTFTSTPILTAQEDAVYTYIVLAEDVDVGDVLIYSAVGTLPSWLTFTPGTRTLTGTPTNANLGDTTVTLRVYDGTVNVDQTFTINVSNTNDPPVFTSTPVLSVLEDAVYSYTVLAEDVDVGDVLTYSAVGTLPSWLTFTPATRLLTGTPTNENVGDTTVTLRVNDGTVNVDQIFTITVTNTNDPPTFTSTPILTAAEDALYTYTAVATDVDVGDVLTYSVVGTLPSWLTFTPATQILTGTPTNSDLGDHAVTIRVNDGTVDVDQTFTINVTNTNDPPTFTSTPILSVLEDALYTYTAVATDVDVGDVLTYSAVGTLPSWLTFTPATQILTGTPTNDNVGDTTVTLRVNDGTVNVDQTFTITVTNTNDPPTFTSTPILTAPEDALYTYTALATDVDVGDVLTYSVVGTLPAWLTFTPATRILTGTPTNDDVGDHAVIIRVNDGTVNVDQAFTITVTNTNDAPTFTSTPILTGTQGVAYAYIATATDVDVGDVLTLSATVLPSWLTFTPASGILSGTPGNDNVGDNLVTLQVNDGTVNVDQTFTIVVANVNDAPTFTSTPITSVQQNAAYIYAVTAVDIDNDVLHYRATVLPSWLNFDTTSHVLSGIPTYAEVGTHPVTLTIFDGTVTVPQSFNVTVGNVNDAPTFTSTPITTASQGSAYSYLVTATDLDNDPIHYRATVLPVWLTFDTTTHVLSGTPGNEHVGDHPVTLTIFDGIATIPQSFTITVANVNDAPTFTSTPITLGQQGNAYSYTAIAVDIDNDSLSYRATVLPAWLTFDTTTHVLSGIPANENVGNNAVTLTVFDGTVTVPQSFNIAVANVNDAPTFTSIPDTTASQGTLYSYTVTAVDVDNDGLIYGSPVLPPWLSFNTTTHVLSGTPGNEHVGAHSVMLSVFDGLVTVTQSFTITVADVNDAPVFTSTPVTSGLQGVQYTYTASATDLDNDVLTFSAPVIPGWLTFNATSHVLSGIPGNEFVGNNLVTLRVSDGTVNVDQTFLITVVNVNDAPVITSQPDTVARPGSAYEYIVTAVDIDGDPLTYTVPVLPDWLVFNASTHTLSATPGEVDVGYHNVTIRVTDGNLSDEQSFVIEVGYGNHAPTFISDPETSAVIGTAYIYTIQAVDIDGDNLTYSAPVLPGWLTFYPNTNVISGIPQSGNLGIHSITVRVTDGTVSADQSFSVTVRVGNSAPVFTSVPVTTATVDEQYGYAVSAEDLDGDLLVYSAPQLPNWLSLDMNTHLLSGIPDVSDTGVHNVTLAVSDGSLTIDQDFVITVEKSNVGIYEPDSPGDLSVYPNPTDGRFIVELSKELYEEATLEVLDVTGKVLIQKDIPPHQILKEEFNLSDQPAGLYFIRILLRSDYLIGKVILH